MEIRPFRALRYDSTRVRLEDVLTQPYDKISPAMQDEYYRRHPWNLVRFELAKREPNTRPEQTYEQSRSFLAELQRDRVLKCDEVPSLYAYLQHYRHPLNPGQQLERMGLIALGRLYRYDEGVVYRHELTLSGPKADRLELLRATRTHSGQIFMLYEDTNGRTEAQLAAASAGRAPDCTVVDEYGIENLLWQVSDSQTVGALVAGFAEKKTIIADGHHRYETALAYRDGQTKFGGAAAHDFVMMTFVNMNSPGLIVLPTHRVVFGLDVLDDDSLRRRLAEFFTVETIGVPAEQLWRVLEAQREQTAFVLADASGTYLLRGHAERVAAALPDLSPAERRLDVAVLHRLILERTLGLSEEDIREQRHVRYFRESGQALEQLRHGANAVFLLNPVPLPVLRDICYSGKVLPQKSTDFYPKLLSGLALYSLDCSFAEVAPAGGAVPHQ